MSTSLSEKEQFLSDVKDHQMKVMKDDGLYRHLSFGVPNSSNQRFDLITWKGHLCYCGDMGSYVFQRTDDMFSFFRKPNDYQSIDYGYWAEKVIAQDKPDGIKKYSPELFTKMVLAEVKDFIDSNTLSEKQIKELNESITDDVLYASDDENYARNVANNYVFDNNEGVSFEFQDFQEHNLTEYTHRFKWCCMALIWGINKYYKENNK